MDVTRDQINVYLADVKEAIQKGKYKIERNIRRQDNNILFEEYDLDESKAREILLDLEVKDFSEVVANRHVGFEHERLYIFGKTVELWERFESRKQRVSIYIKINKLETSFVIVVSFHEQKYPMEYCFK